MIKSASQSSLTNDVKYRSMSAGIVPSNQFLIRTIEVGATPLPSITFDNLQEFNGIYRHFQIVWTGRSGSNAGATLSSGLRFNGDSTSGNYRWHSLRGNGSNAGSFDSSTSNRAAAGLIAGSTASSGVFAVNVIDILDPYSATKNKTIRVLAGQGEIYLYSGAWFSTSAVTSISIFDIYSSSFQQYSRFSLYGVTV